MKKAMVCLVVMGMTLVITGCGKAPKIEDYRPCDKALKFELTDTTVGGSEGNGMALSSVGGMTVNGTDIPLKSKAIENGMFVVTRDFGKIMVKIGAGTSFGRKLTVDFFLAPEQERKLMDSLGARQR